VTAHGNIATVNKLMNPIPISDTEAPSTRIDSVNTENGKSVEPGGSLESGTIRFKFVGTDNISIAGYECSLDFKDLTCDNELTVAVPKGIHVLQVSAIDASGNRDQSPASFSWNVIDSPLPL